MAKKPDYDLTFMNKTTGERGRLGAAWKNNDQYGSITIRLNPFVTLRQEADLVFRLFPVRDAEPTEAAGEEERW